jgi:pilus assembly protein CpaF
VAFSIILTEKGGDTRRLDFESEEITVGRIEENDICLPKGNISKKHTKIVVKDGIIFVFDLKSTNGTYVNGKKLIGPQVILPEDRIYIGDFILNVAPFDGKPKRKEPPTPMPLAMPGPLPDTPFAPQRARSAPGAGKGKQAAGPASADAVSNDEARANPAAAPEPARPPEPASKAENDASPGASAEYGSVLTLVHDRLIQALDLRRLDLDALGGGELRKKAEASARQIIARMDKAGELAPQIDRGELLQDVLNEALGLGPLEIYLRDDTVSEIMVNTPTQVYVERNGRLERVAKTFSSAQAVLSVIERIVAPLGRHIDESSPLVDARLADGSRVNAIIPPLALKGPCITIRKFKRDLLTSSNLIDFGALTPQMAEFLQTCVTVRRNVVISGGTGSGKTTLLNILSGYIPEVERIVTIEDAAELQLSQEHWVALEARPSNIEGKGQISIRDLVRNSLRMRPDRIVIGECRGGEALDMLQAMNTGHDGSLTTLHANSPRDALSRLETMVLMSGMELPIRAIREQIANAVHLVVQQTRFADGTRRVSAISEVSGMELDVITLQDIFTFKQDGFDVQGRVQGRFIATGFVPRFYEDLQSRGIPVDMGIFRED